MRNILKLYFIIKTFSSTLTLKFTLFSLSLNELENFNLNKLI